MPPQLQFYPRLLNSACPWATTADDLRRLLLCPSTGAVTTRTSLLQGFNHDHAAHRYLFFDPSTARPAVGTASGPETPPASANDTVASASLNSLGYSPITLQEYLKVLQQLADELPDVTKTIIISVTGSAEDVRGCYDTISQAASSIRFPLAMEINLSCPNIPGKPPPAYDGPALSKYLAILPHAPGLPIGVKTPPYTYHAQFATLIMELRQVAEKISFITATNTLGSCLILDPVTQLPGQGVGGMAGPPLHPLALGNVATIKRMLDEVTELNHIQIIGIGGVSDGAGYRRFKQVGAFAVGVGTALGKQGVAVFDAIVKDNESQ
ncbi:putative dihydroorotate dehydrogenase A (fumarate) [Paramyrothecium foliicola]|nr:putative dihydroorotate dehydrogenase A (fumarate) [Paramyrothecium foliicola]